MPTTDNKSPQQKPTLSNQRTRRGASQQDQKLLDKNPASQTNGPTPAMPAKAT